MFLSTQYGADLNVCVIFVIKKYLAENGKCGASSTKHSIHSISLSDIVHTQSAKITGQPSDITAHGGKQGLEKCLQTDALT